MIMSPQDQPQGLVPIATPDEMLHRYIERFTQEIALLASGGISAVIAVGDGSLATVIVGIGPKPAKIVAEFGKGLDEFPPNVDWKQQMERENKVSIAELGTPESN